MPPSDFELIEMYVRDMRFRGLLENTVNVRIRYLTKFAKEVGFADATETKIIQWLGSRELKLKTRAMWCSTLSAFYKWAARDGIFEGYTDPRTGVRSDFNPVERVPKARLHPNRPRPMPDDDIARALANAGPKMKCWILMGAYGTLRCQEICYVEREDIDDVNNTLLITHGKGAKSRFVPLHPDLLKALQELPMPESGRLWPQETPASVSRKGNRFLHSLQIPSTMHTLRHWAGTHLYRASLDLQLVADLMGHSNTAVTSVYAAADQSKSAGVVTGLHI